GYRSCPSASPAGCTSRRSIWLAFEPDLCGIGGRLSVDAREGWRFRVLFRRYIRAPRAADLGARSGAAGAASARGASSGWNCWRTGLLADRWTAGGRVEAESGRLKAIMPGTRP